MCLCLFVCVCVCMCVYVRALACVFPVLDCVYSSVRVFSFHLLYFICFQLILYFCFFSSFYESQSLFATFLSFFLLIFCTNTTTITSAKNHHPSITPHDSSYKVQLLKEQSIWLELSRTIIPSYSVHERLEVSYRDYGD